MKGPSLLIAVLMICLGGALEEPFLKIGGWNLKRFGRTKMQDATKVDLMLKVLTRYDIVLIMEVVDASGEALVELEAAMNTNITTGKYKLEKSPRLGRSSYQEEYVFLYREDKIEVANTSLYADPKDVFQFEPYTVLFTSPTDSFDDFAIMPLHSKPDDAETEIDAMVDVCDAILNDNETTISDIILIGDFNAGCSYVTSKEWSNVRLKQQDRFNWMIDDRTDTTTANSICPYDRIVLYGDNLLNNVLPNSAKPYYFDEDLGITPEEAEKLTDHYPVEIQLMTNRAKEMSSVPLTKNMEVFHSISPNAFENLKQAAGTKQCNLDFTDTGGVSGSWEVSSAADIESTLNCVTGVVESVVSKLQIETLTLWAHREDIQPQTNLAVSVTCASCSKLCVIRVSYSTSVIDLS